MNESTLDQLSEVFQNVFDTDDLVVRRDLTAADVDEWDSLAHIRLMLRVEKHFGIKFTASEIGKLKSVGDLVDLIDRKKS